MLIVEGTDLVGKTTVCEKLWAMEFFQLRGYEIQHCSRQAREHDHLWDYVHRMNRKAIFDRFYLSDSAYTLARGESHDPFPPEMHRFVHGHALTYGAWTVLIVVDPAQWTEVMEARVWRDDEMYSLRTIREVNTAFNKLWQTRPWCVDQVVMLTAASPFVTDSQINTILFEYETQMRKVERWNVARRSF